MSSIVAWVPGPHPKFYQKFNKPVCTPLTFADESCYEFKVDDDPPDDPDFVFGECSPSDDCDYPYSISVAAEFDYSDVTSDEDTGDCIDSFDDTFVAEYCDESSFVFNPVYTVNNSVYETWDNPDLPSPHHDDLPYVLSTESFMLTSYDCAGDDVNVGVTEVRYTMKMHAGGLLGPFPIQDIWPLGTLEWREEIWHFESGLFTLLSFANQMYTTDVSTQETSLYTVALVTPGSGSNFLVVRPAKFTFTH